MKKSLSLLAAFLVAGLFAAPVQAADQYVSAFGGMSWMNEGNLDSGLAATAAIGCDYGDTRLEAEMGYQNNSFDDFYYGESDVNLYTLMANGYYDVDLGGIDMYLTAGVGLAQGDVDYGNGSFDVQDGDCCDDDSFAYQFGAGLAAPIATGVMLDARYRYFTTIDNDQLSSHSALLGLRVSL